MGGRTILVVEDDRDLREALDCILRLEGFDPVCTADGRAALDHLSRAERPQLILLDLMLPEMDGVCFRAALTKDPRLRSIPVVIVSAHLDTPLTARRLALPYLTKPFEAHALLETVKRYAQSG